MNSDWHEDIFKAALPILSVEFVVLNKRGEIVHDARQGETWQDMLPDAQHEPTEEPAFLKDTSRAEFHNAVVAAASPEGKTTLVPVFGEEDTPQMVLVTPMGGSDLGLALVIFEGGQTDHTWWLGQLFDIYKLTPSERQVARGIIFGQTVTEIASDADWSVATVRSYVKQVLSKMGLHRQSELITLYHSSKLPIAKTQSLHGKPGYRT
ncbi:MAG: helix-turn-helix transcriptional regulator [Pseudomonadota bacterium]